MHDAADERHGQVFIAPHPHLALRGSFTAYWDNGEPDKNEPPRMLEQAPVFAEVEEAIAWGRARARRVLVRLGNDSTRMYSAGSEPLPWNSNSPESVLPEWPPEH
jgi:cytidine deaminase